MEPANDLFLGQRTGSPVCPGLADRTGRSGQAHQPYGTGRGYTAWVVLVPELNLGVSVLMNQGSTTSPQTAIIRQVIDLFRGVESDWITKTYEEYMRPPAARKPEIEKEFIQPLDNKVYMGVYFKELFGETLVYEKKDSLYLKINDIDAPLKHISGNTYRFNARDEVFDITFNVQDKPDWAVSYTIDFGDDLGSFVRVFK